MLVSENKAASKRKQFAEENRVWSLFVECNYELFHETLMMHDPVRDPN